MGYRAEGDLGVEILLRFEDIPRYQGFVASAYLIRQEKATRLQRRSAIFALGGHDRHTSMAIHQCYQENM